MQTEETKNADRNGPIGIISSIGISLIVGWGYILGITFAVKDVPYLLSPDNDAGGYAIAEVVYLAFKSRYGMWCWRDHLPVDCCHRYILLRHGLND